MTMKKRGIMNEDFRECLLWFFMGFIFVVLMLFPFFCSGCSTVGLQGKDAELVSRHSRNIGRIEGTASALADAVADSRDRLEVVSRASERIGDGIERLDYLFTEYEREVERLCNEIDSLRAQIEQVEGDGFE